MNEFALLTGDPLVPRLEVAEEQADLLQRGTVGDVFQEWPLIVREIAITNTQPAHREAFEALMAIGLADPRGFGGECAGELAPFDLLNPLIVWALPDHLDHLLYYQEIWPSSTLVLLGNQSGLSHFTPFDFEQEIAAAIAQYAQSIFP